METMEAIFFLFYAVDASSASMRKMKRSQIARGIALRKDTTRDSLSLSLLRTFFLKESEIGENLLEGNRATNLRKYSRARNVHGIDM